MKKILLPIDFSETSDNAFVYAIEMAKIFKAELVLLHTFELPIVDSQSLPINYAVIYETIELTNFDHFKEKNPGRDLTFLEKCVCALTGGFVGALVNKY